MINIFSVNEKVIAKVKELTNIEQVINDSFLETFDNKDLKYPRIIVRLGKIKDSEFHYSGTEYVSTTDRMEQVQNNIATISYDIDFVTNAVETGDTCEQLEFVRDYLNFKDGSDKLDGIESVVRYVSNIVPLKVARFQNADTVYRLSFNVDINNVAVKNVGYANKFESDLDLEL